MKVSSDPSSRFVRARRGASPAPTLPDSRTAIGVRKVSPAKKGARYRGMEEGNPLPRWAIAYFFAFFLVFAFLVFGFEGPSSPVNSSPLFNGFPP